MYRSHNCGQLRIENVGEEVRLAGWVARSRKMGGMTFIDLRDRYGITQLVVDEEANSQLHSEVEKLGREFVVSVVGVVIERSSKNSKMATGDIEIKLNSIEVLNSSLTPPFTIEEESDGGEELRAKYRYLDLRREPLKRAMELRHRVGQEIRNYLDSLGFFEIETPMLIKSTPEGARDFIVPSRMNPGEFYALPQSPQTFKQLLMVAGYDRYFQIVRCFRDEDLRADRQPEFTQVDCELAFVEREDVLNLFEEMMRHLLKKIAGATIEEKFPRITYSDAMRYYGSDKPDIRFKMKLVELKAADQGVDLTSGVNFPPFDNAEYVGAVVLPGGASYTRREVDSLIDWVRRPQIGATGMVYIRVEEGGSRSSVDKFYSEERRGAIVKRTGAEVGDLILIMAGEKRATQVALGSLRIELANRLGLRDAKQFAPLWVTDFPLVEWDEESGRFYAMHHPFTAPRADQLESFYSDDREKIASVTADAYDFVLNGAEVGGGSIRIHNSKVQQRMFEILGLTNEEADEKFGFIIDAFKYGAPPHGGIAFGFDRMVALFGGDESIREYIAFPKNSSGRDVMLDAPSQVDQAQLDELKIKSLHKG